MFDHKSNTPGHFSKLITIFHEPEGLMDDSLIHIVSDIEYGDVVPQKEVTDTSHAQTHFYGLNQFDFC
jgi:hypothetical protein